MESTKDESGKHHQDSLWDDSALGQEPERDRSGRILVSLPIPEKDKEAFAAHQFREELDHLEDLVVIAEVIGILCGVTLATIMIGMAAVLVLTYL